MSLLWLLPAAVGFGVLAFLFDLARDVARARRLRREQQDAMRAVRMAEWRKVNHRGER